MNFVNYSDDPVSLAVDLVNTYGWTSGVDSLETLAALEAFLAERAASWQGAVPTARESDLAPIRALRGSLQQVFASSDADEAVAILNRILAESGATPLLSTHGGTPHLHFQPATDGLPHWLAVVTAMGIATVIADEGFERLGICQAADCRDAYVDTSRNRSRRHCSDSCRTRGNVAAYRERQRSKG